MAGRSGRPEDSWAPIRRAYDFVERALIDTGAQQRIEWAADAAPSLGGRSQIDLGDLLRPGWRAYLVGRLLKGEGSIPVRLYLAAAALRVLASNERQPFKNPWVLGQAVADFGSAGGSAQVGKALARLESSGLIIPGSQGGSGRRAMVLRPVDDPWFDRPFPGLPDEEHREQRRASLKVPVAFWTHGWLAMLTKQESVLLLSLLDAAARETPSATLGTTAVEIATLRPSERRLRGITNDAYEHRRLLEDMGLVSLVPLPEGTWSLRTPDIYSPRHSRDFLQQQTAGWLFGLWTRAAEDMVKRGRKESPSETEEQFFAAAREEMEAARERQTTREQNRLDTELAVVRAQIAASIADMRALQAELDARNATT